jgi:tetratricopeptide (TPR) repeat protein
MTTDMAEGRRLLQLLDGLPLAIAQAGAYLQESGVGLETYLRFYGQQWDELMKEDAVADGPLQDYPDRSVWTTWAISYQAIRDKHEHTANLLLLWSFLDNKDLWHGLFAAACEASPVAKTMLTAWVGEIANSELAFSQAMRLLRNYSLVEEMEEIKSYATHPVVHRWARHYQGKQSAKELSQVAVTTVGWAVPDQSGTKWSALQRRLLPHAQMCFSWVLGTEPRRGSEDSKQRELRLKEGERDRTLLIAIRLIGDLYNDQAKFVEAELLYEWALNEKKEVLGPKHIWTLQTMGNLGNVYMNRGKVAEAEHIFRQSLQGFDHLLAPDHSSRLQTIGNLGMLYKKQGKLAEAEPLLKQALHGMQETLGPKHKSTLLALNNLGLLYKNQHKLEQAERMLGLALQGKTETLGPNHLSTLQTIGNLGIVYKNQGKLARAEQMYEQALLGKEEVLGPKHIVTLETVGNLGKLYMYQGKLAEAEHMYERALHGFDEVLGTEHSSTLQLVRELVVVYSIQGKPKEAGQMFDRVRYNRQ